MKQTAKTDAGQAPRSTEPESSRPARQALTSGGRLSQLAAIANDSRQVRASARLSDEVQRSRGVQSLRGLAKDLNSGAPSYHESVGRSGSAEENTPVQGKFLLKNPDKATANMKTAVKAFMAAIRAINGELVQLIDGSDTINVIIDPGTAIGVAGSGETKLERQTNAKDKPETFVDTMKEIVKTNSVTDQMRTQPLVLRIQVNQKGLSGATEGTVGQLAETLAHEYSLHAEAQLEAIKALRNPDLSNSEALRAIVASSDRGAFNDGDAQHKQLEQQKGDRYDAMVAVIDTMKRTLTSTDAAALQKAFADDVKDRH